MAVSCLCDGSSRSSSRSALAWAMAASGFRISCAIAADIRPMAAILATRTLASTSRRSSRNITHSASSVLSCAAASRVRTCRCRRLFPGSLKATSALCGCLSEKVRIMMSTSGSNAAWVARTKGGVRTVWSMVIKRWEAGLAERTMPAASMTSTPSVSASMTSWLTCVWMRVACWLTLADCSSRAKRSASWLASKATAKKPVPLSPACKNRAAESPGNCTEIHQASSRSSSVTLAAVPRASKIGPRIEESSTGNANSGV